MHPLLKHVAHRPWPVPIGPWIMTQTWNDLLFADWPVTPEALRPHVPSELSLDIFDGTCWIAVTPFYMTGIRARGLPPVPGLSRLPELNVRTYVSAGDKPGVYFFSLDAGNRAAVWGARTFYKLPYFYARMLVQSHGDFISYESHREKCGAEFRGRYRPTAAVRLRDTGTLEHWLSERYCLYTVSRGDVYRAEIHHAQWPLRDAEAEIEINTMAAAAGIVLPRKLTPAALC